MTEDEFLSFCPVTVLQEVDQEEEPPAEYYNSDTIKLVETCFDETTLNNSEKSSIAKRIAERRPTGYPEPLGHIPIDFNLSDNEFSTDSSSSTSDIEGKSPKMLATACLARFNNADFPPSLIREDDKIN